MNSLNELSGVFVDIFSRKLRNGIFEISDGKIVSFRDDNDAIGPYIMPGFVDAHIHIESSMLVPYEFARVALRYGTVATVSDPHEIANVMGVDGVEYMLENAKGAGLKFCFGAPSCVPATVFESAGAKLDSNEVNSLLQRDDIYYLSEMMNYPGVLFKDPEVLRKIELAKKIKKPVDGHAPGLRGDDAKNYIAAGISTDHECFTLDEALDKLSYGMKILIREGSAARNFEALHPLLKDHADMCMFCCDDKHPDELLTGHINEHVKRAVKLGYDLFDVLRVACINPVMHYGIPSGLLRPGDSADFILVEDLKNFGVLKTVINGEILFDGTEVLLEKKKHKVINNFNAGLCSPADFELKAESTKVKTIIAYDGQLITSEESMDCAIVNGMACADPSKDILKIVVLNRYQAAKPSVAFIKNFGLKSGAIASSVAHDSHNIIAVGVSDEEIASSVNLLVESRGGLSLSNKTEKLVLSLPVAGLMSDLDCITAAELYSALDKKAKELGSTLRAPYMTLSFMALLVIPQLKLSDKGLFDGNTFVFADLFVE
ncbi:MAG: adenine deaminase [Bacteroidetes bacterium]|nr:MAG: adenine deaminase [Bacteroidota bacterium]REJ99976.1 MAG: adenine deaminase [Bacteroidota bacterium]REK35844.1 MAG: adenine deaminase [Bacteroidota bacterium]